MRSAGTRFPRRAALALLDHGLPLALGASLAYAAYALNISRCRGWTGSDQGNHLMTSLEFVPGDLLNTVYPPLTYLWSNLLYGLLGPGRQAGELSVALFLIPLAWFLYQAGKLLGGRPAGALAMGAVCLAAPVQDLAQIYLLDLPLTCAVAGTVWAQLRAGMFQDRRAALALAPMLTAGMLIKYNYFYFLGPLLLAGVLLLHRATRRAWLTAAATALLAAHAAAVIGLTVWRGPAHELGSLSAAPALLYAPLPLLFVLLGRLGDSPLVRDNAALASLRNLLLAASLGLLPALPWYSWNFSRLWHYWFDMTGRVSAPAGGGIGMGELLTSQVGGWHAGFIPMLAVGLILTPLVRRQRAGRLLLLLGAAAAGLLLALTVTPQVRFFVPLLPAMALLSAWWLGRLGRLAWPALLVVAGLNIWAAAAGSTPGARPRAAARTLAATSLTLPRAVASPGVDEARACAAARGLETLASRLRRQGGPLWLILCADEAEYHDFRETRALVCADRRVLAHEMGVRQYDLRFLVLSRPRGSNDGHLMERVEPGMVVLSASQQDDLAGAFEHKTGLPLQPLGEALIVPGQKARLYRVGPGAPWLLQPDRYVPGGRSPNDPLMLTPPE